MAYSTLLPGITVALPMGESPAERIRLSAGTETTSDPACEADARIPKLPWRAPSEHEIAALAPRGPFLSNGECVALVPLAFDFEQHFAELRSAAATAPSVDSVRAMAASPACKRAADRLHDYIRQEFEHGTAGGEPLGGICVKASGRVATTTDPNTRQAVGLHLDNWTRISFRSRSATENRICVNLGRDDRFLLFFNLPICEIYRAVKSAPADAISALPVGNAIARSTLDTAHELLGGTRIARAFMALYPAYPVVSLRVKPGEAYLAPTENMVHDGSSEGSHAADLTLMIRGRFVPGAAARPPQVPVGA